MNTSTSYPTDAEWTPADRDAALAEGWDIFDCDGSENGRAQLCRCDLAATLPSDDGAWWHVTMRAKRGSALHAKALAVIAQHNPEEARAIERLTARLSHPITASISVRAARDVAEFLDRTIPTHCRAEDAPGWGEVRDALYALANDTDIIHARR